VAIVQISRITNRKGLTEDLPQLAGAELGWCLDSRRLFIGNGTLQAGAPVIGNTEILTEFSDVTALSAYTYKDVAVGYAAQTGPSASDPVVRTVQEKLDDFADVRDFGAIGDGIADDTAAINRALYQLYCRETNTQIRRSLFFPAGTYLVTSSIVIPTYAKLVGEGADCSTILLDPDDSSVPDYVAQYGDSLQQTGAMIGNNGAITPRNIEISSMTFQSTISTDIFFVTTAQQCWFDSVNFIGPFTQDYIIDSSFDPAGVDDISGVIFDSTPVNVTNQINFTKCGFSGLAYGIKTDEQINAVTVSDSKFSTLYQGIVLGAGTPILGGATGFRAVHNMFDDIYAEGIVYDQVSLNACAHNIFYNVGNSIGAGIPTSPVVRFGNDNNVSIADLFERSYADSQVEPRVQISGTTTNTTAGAVGANPGSQLQLGRYARQAGQTYSIANSVVSNQPVFSVDTALTRAWKMDYTVIRDTRVRTGSLMVASDGISINWTDDYNENTTTDLVLTPVLTGGIVSLTYDSTAASGQGSLVYSLAYLA